MIQDLELSGPRGDNPLGFLSVLGALRTLDDVGLSPLLYWNRLTAHILVDFKSVNKSSQQHLLDTLFYALKKRAVNSTRNKELNPVALFNEKNINFENERLYSCSELVFKRLKPRDRRLADLLSSLCAVGAKGKVEASNWVLINGQGHQDFLGTAVNLMCRLEKHHLEKALFGPWEDKDEGSNISFRWDPAEDRRYALMDVNPSSKKPMTILGANALAFESLRFFPAFIARGNRLKVVAWSEKGNKVRWPLWRYHAGVEVVRSMLCDPDVWKVPGDVDASERLRNMGIFAVIQTEKIKTGRYNNMTPGKPVWLVY